jgi:cell pole-organizing protein PopZ
MPATMAENGSKFRWSEQKAEAAVLVAEDRLTDRQIAARVGIADRQFYRWKDHPAFLARVDEHVKRMDAACARRAIARKSSRVQALQDRWQRMQAVIDARADDPDNAAAAGGTTGLLVKQRRSIGSGEAAEIVDEFAVDTGLLKEMREHEKQAAQEMNQWTHHHEHRGGIVHAHLHAAAADLAARSPADVERICGAALGPPAADW